MLIIKKLISATKNSFFVVKMLRYFHICFKTNKEKQNGFFWKYYFMVKLQR